MPRLLKNRASQALIAAGLFVAVLGANAQAAPGKLRSGVWQGGIRTNAQGVATTCYLFSVKKNNEFSVILIWNSLGFHIALYNEKWKLPEGKSFRARVRIDDLFDQRVDATVVSNDMIDYAFGGDEPSVESVQAGRKIRLQSPTGPKKFRLRGTRNAIDLLMECADKYIGTTTDRSDTRSAAAPSNATPSNTVKFAGDVSALEGRAVVHPGDKLEVVFTAEPGLHERSWVGFVADNAAPDPTPFHSGAADLNARRSGTLAVTVPRTLGNLQLWMYDAWNRRRLASIPVRVVIDRDSAALDLPDGARVGIGQKFDVLFRASPNYTSYVWVALVGADTPKDIRQEDIKDIQGRVYLQGRTKGRLTFTAPMRPGRYLLRMHDLEFNKTLRELDLDVVDPEARNGAASTTSNTDDRKPELALSAPFAGDGVTGEWTVVQGNFRAIAFDQMDELVEGTVSSPDGAFQGELTDGTLSGVWAVPEISDEKTCEYARLGSRRWGSLEARLSEDGMTLTGAWGNCKEARFYPFQATRTKPDSGHQP